MQRPDQDIIDVIAELNNYCEFYDEQIKKSQELIAYGQEANLASQLKMQRISSLLKTKLTLSWDEIKKSSGTIEFIKIAMNNLDYEKYPEFSQELEKYIKDTHLAIKTIHERNNILNGLEDISWDQ